MPGVRSRFSAFPGQVHCCKALGLLVVSLDVCVFVVDPAGKLTDEVEYNPKLGDGALTYDLSASEHLEQFGREIPLAHVGGLLVVQSLEYGWR